MNTFKELFNFVKTYDKAEDNNKMTKKEQREFIKKEIKRIMEDVLTKSITEVKILRRDKFGFKVKYFNNGMGTEDYLKITFSMATYKAYVYDGKIELEFRVLE
ncbi:hypothetical protein BJV85_002853 [Clostridium acetobutylicum]|uniref:Uncharacterized protein n=1 Tax=Clostridium acetobutylicum (strain ATCC 824 / DSM 792 / JCM 1419 / IAM 19013 / LMG 5710 / NBRC 13948 / NRRL B-527 / VKM B-1787 / 2291 / W) TaxID=272562 RepID=Q97JX7_CLOAB|nr:MULTISPECIES: hypothetical protein [Clostridium]AAK79118.1 Hypothetical protein CA_C1146 [Clostridium acetobutylicum ATCC 824]ADZ20196.1 Conserved hypothetical protein [Clostridium acetobutylicum EA 2018]AEI31654.1 hypothetical protein SMB_G1166 [Clostridium acetobutylicum DSM 1731]AWV81628.1 hypothetical protein DK921_16325 [Clostridium acetobutylicum]MBC2393272.1 hypothetical protein [Clostridium acetobutylicum]